MNYAFNGIQFFSLSDLIGFNDVEQASIIKQPFNITTDYRLSLVSNRNSTISLYGDASIADLEFESLDINVYVIE